MVRSSLAAPAVSSPPAAANLARWAALCAAADAAAARMRWGHRLLLDGTSVPLERAERRQEPR